MALKDRKKFLKDFDKFIKQRSSANITKAKIVLNYDEWAKHILRGISGEQSSLFGEEEELGNPKIWKTWKELGKELQKWSKKPPTSKQTWTVKHFDRRQKKKYVIEAQGKVMSSPAIGQFTRITWSKNLVVSLRNVIKKWARSYKPDTTVIAEHGKTVEKKAVTSPTMAFVNPQTPGQRGTNVHTAMIKALKLAADNVRIDVFGRAIGDFIRHKFVTRVDRRKTTETLQREHTIEFVVVPESDQKGVLDRQTIKELKDYVKNLNLNALVRKHLADQPEDVINAAVSSSPSYTDELRLHASKLAIQSLFPHKSKPNMRLKVNKELAKQLKKENKKGSKSTVEGKKGQSKTVVSKEVFGGVAAGLASNKRKAKPKTTQNNALSLRNMLNSILPPQVAMNMTEPALRFRTGRFANSVRVTNVAQGPRGGLHLDYTYLREPYETFEPGGKQGSTLRDPRRLIGGTIRQIMAQQAITRFNLKRV